MSDCAQSRVADARRVFGFEHWPEGYFRIDDAGRVRVVLPGSETDAAAEPLSVDLPALLETLKAQGLSPPVLLRFPDILRARVRDLRRVFAQAAAAQGYRAGYLPAYPIKVNQNRVVVETFAALDDVALECGSKPELLICLASAKPGATIICNGYKDADFLRAAAIGAAAGLRVIVVIEKLSELAVLLRLRATLPALPLLGLRVRLASIGAGHWQNTGGAKSKFGLDAAQLVEALESLKAAALIESVRLLHFHMGSQLANIHDIQAGLREGLRYFTDMRRAGVPVTLLDVGGGLAIDYEGRRTRASFSRNYTLAEYADKLVQAVAAVCRRQGLPEPTIVTEAGRAMTAHHAVLLADVVDTQIGAPATAMPTSPPWLDAAFASAQRRLATSNPIELAQDLLDLRRQCMDQFLAGSLDLAGWAQADGAVHHLAKGLAGRLDPSRPDDREAADGLDALLLDKLYCNLSVFQSLPDIWGLRQVFPVLPIAALDRPLTDRVTVQDLTCDSDGRVDHFPLAGGVAATLPAAESAVQPGAVLGFFLVGAYQEPLGDIHNLFGRPASAVVRRRGDGVQCRGCRGDTVSDMLAGLGFGADDLRARFAALERAGAPGGARWLTQMLDRSTYLSTAQAGD